jgi:hypothetical protein
MIRLEDIPELSASEAEELLKEFENLIDVSGISYIETLLSTSSFDHDYRERILRELPEMNLERSYESTQPRSRQLRKPKTNSKTY